MPTMQAKLSFQPIGCTVTPLLLFRIPVLRATEKSAGIRFLTPRSLRISERRLTIISIVSLMSMTRANQGSGRIGWLTIGMKRPKPSTKSSRVSTTGAAQMGSR